MSNALRYVPVMKTKDAEFRSLAQIAPAVRERISPLFEVQPPPRDWDTGEPKPLAEHLEVVPAKLAKLEPVAGILLDLPWIQPWDANIRRRAPRRGRIRSLAGPGRADRARGRPR